MKTCIYSPYNCLVISGKEEHFVEAKESLSLENPAKILVYPTGKSEIIPFCIEEKFSPFYSIIEKDGERLVFLLQGLFCQNVIVHSFSFGGEKATIEVSSSQIIFSCPAHKKIIALPFQSSDFQCGNLYHIGYVKFASPESEHLIFFNAKNGQCKIYQGREIILNSPKFEVVFLSGKKEVLAIDKEGLKSKSKDFSSIKILSNPLFIAKDFVDCLKNEDFEKAHSYLCPALQSAQSVSSLQDFFGSISFDFPLSPYKIFVLSNGEGKLLTFSFEGGKISDILI